MSFFQPGIPYVGDGKITQIDPTKSYYLGTIVFFISMIFAYNYVLSEPSVYKLDTTGCILDLNGVRVREPIYGTQYVYRNGSWRNESTGQIVGYKECVTPMATFTKYLIAIGVSAIIGLSAGSALYNFQFKIANPQLAANIYANEQLASSRWR